MMQMPTKTGCTRLCLYALVLCCFKKKRFPNIKTLRLRTDGAGNFRNSSFVLLMPKLSQWTGVNILEFSVSETGGGKDLTDSLIMQQKQRIREGVKQTGASARNATECVATVQKGEEQVGSRGSCATREMIYNRPSGGVIGAKRGRCLEFRPCIITSTSLQRLMFLWESGFFVTRESCMASSTRPMIVTLCCCSM